MEELVRWVEDTISAWVFCDPMRISRFPAPRKGRKASGEEIGTEGEMEGEREREEKGTTKRVR
jgi:hypothetical protein